MSNAPSYSFSAVALEQGIQTPATLVDKVLSRGLDVLGSYWM